MHSERAILLEKFIAEDPMDPFNYYALAMECIHTDHEKADHLFNHLLTHFPTYLPTYYQAAVWYANQNQLEKASGIIEKGIQLAEAQQNSKTRNELRNLGEELLF